MYDLKKLEKFNNELIDAIEKQLRVGSMDFEWIRIKFNAIDETSDDKTSTLDFETKTVIENIRYNYQKLISLNLEMARQFNEGRLGV